MFQVTFGSITANWLFLYRLTPSDQKMKYVSKNKNFKSDAADKSWPGRIVSARLGVNRLGLKTFISARGLGWFNCCQLDCKRIERGPERKV